LASKYTAKRARARAHTQTDTRRQTHTQTDTHTETDTQRQTRRQTHTQTDPLGYLHRNGTDYKHQSNPQLDRNTTTGVAHRATVTGPGYDAQLYRRPPRD